MSATTGLFKLPETIKMVEAINIVQNFTHSLCLEKYYFDFKNVKKISPDAMLYLSNELDMLKKRCTVSDKKILNYKHLTKLADMGFFQSFGAEFGVLPNEGISTSRVIPIKEVRTADLKKEALEWGIPCGELLHNHAGEVAKILCRTDQGKAYKTTEYCVREILRNIIEHSESLSFLYCAEYEIESGLVKFAVIDQGMGLRLSLSKNPKLHIKDDLDAINQSMKPGVSSSSYLKDSAQFPEWQNSGYGLYMTSEICIGAKGSFLLASNSKGVFKTDVITNSGSLILNGTLVSLEFSVDNICDLDNRLEELRDQVPKDVLTKPSASSMNRFNL